MDDQALRKWKKKIVAILIIHWELQNNLLLVILLICFALLVDELNKKKRRKLCDSHGRQLMMNNKKRRKLYDCSHGRQLARDVNDEGIFDGDEVSIVLEAIAETMDTIKMALEQQSASIRELVSCFKHERETAERRMKLPAVLRDIDGLTVEQRMRACIIIAKNNNMTDLFFSLEPEDRLQLVLTVLRESF